MAWANLGRSKGKTVVTVLSLSLAVVLPTVTATFAGGFDMDKYVSNFTASDFIVANAGKFQTSTLFSAEPAVPQSVIDDIDAQAASPTGRGVRPDLPCAGVRHRRLVPAEQAELLYPGGDGQPDTPDDRTRRACWPTGFRSPVWRICPGPPDGAGGRFVRPLRAGQPGYRRRILRGRLWKRRHGLPLGPVGGPRHPRYVEESEYYDPDTGEVWASLEDVPDGAELGGAAGEVPGR